MKITVEELREWGRTAAYDPDELCRRLAASNLVKAAETLLVALQKQPPLWHLWLR